MNFLDIVKSEVPNHKIVSFNKNGLELGAVPIITALNNPVNVPLVSYVIPVLQSGYIFSLAASAGKGVQMRLYANVNGLRQRDITLFENIYVEQINLPLEAKAGQTVSLGVDLLLHPGGKVNASVNADLLLVEDTK